MRAAGEARGPDRLEPLVLAEGARVCGVEEATLEEPEPRPVEDVPMGEGHL